MVGRDSSRDFSHPDLQLPRIRRDVADVTAFEGLLQNSWINPLSHDEKELVNLSTGILAPPDVARGLLEAHKVGQQAYQMIREDRLEKDPPTVNFNDTLKKQKLKTFLSIMRKQAGNKAQGKRMELKADRNLFGHMIVIAQSRALPKDVLAHPLGPLIWSLANADGSLCKTNKAALKRELEQTVSPAEAIPETSSCIIDGMNLVHKLKGDGKTFAQLADSALNLVLHEGK